MFKKINFVTISFIAVILMIGSLIFSHETYSEKENRYLADFPSFEVTSGYFEKLSNYINDHFLLRDKWITINNNYKRIMFKDEVNDIYICDNDYLIEKYIKSKNNERIIKSINNFIDNNKDVNIQLLISPTSVSINKDLLPKYSINDDQLIDIKEIYDGVNCVNIDVYDSLLNTEDAFYKLDHHWTEMGAYSAYKKYCEINNLTVYPNNLVMVSDTFKGTIYNKSQLKESVSDIIYKYDYSYKVSVDYKDYKNNSLYDESYLDKADKYAYFLSGNHPIVKIHNDTKDDNTNLLIIKDSYANCMIPYLVNNYEDIIVIDPRYYGLSIHDYINENSINNVLFLYNMNTLKDDVGILGIE